MCNFKPVELNQPQQQQYTYPHHNTHMIPAAAMNTSHHGQQPQHNNGNNGNAQPSQTQGNGATHQSTQSVRR